MTHSPPIPPGNQSPYPIIQPPHAPIAPPPRVSVSDTATVRLGMLSTLVVGGVFAGAIAAIATAFVRSRRTADTAKQPARRRAAPKPAAKTRSKPKAARSSLVSGSTAPARTRSTTPKAVPAQKKTPRTGSAKPSRGTRDGSLIAMTEDHEVRYWTQKFGVDRAALQQAVDAVGHSADAVGRELGKS